MNLLTLREVADVVKVSDTTVRRWIRDGSLAAYKVGKRGQLRVREEDLEQFLERQRVDPDSEDGRPHKEATAAEPATTHGGPSTPQGEGDRP